MKYLFINGNQNIELILCLIVIPFSKKKNCEVRGDVFHLEKLGSNLGGRV